MSEREQADPDRVLETAISDVEWALSLTDDTDTGFKLREALQRLHLVSAVHDRGDTRGHLQAAFRHDCSAVSGKPEEEQP